jgi:hypothetical protein
MDKLSDASGECLTRCPIPCAQHPEISFAVWPSHFSKAGVYNTIPTSSPNNGWHWFWQCMFTPLRYSLAEPTASSPPNQRIETSSTNDPHSTSVAKIRRTIAVDVNQIAVIKCPCYHGGIDMLLGAYRYRELANDGYKRFLRSQVTERQILKQECLAEFPCSKTGWWDWR